jgi:hypothetical protein
MSLTQHRIVISLFVNAFPTPCILFNALRCIILRSQVPTGRASLCLEIVSEDAESLPHR